MGAIGGAVNFKGKMDFSRLEKMRKTMLLRGKGAGAAFLCSACGMFFSPMSEEDRQPYICERGGNLFSLCIEGSGFDPSVIMGKYFDLGEDILGLLVGSFSLVLYDGEKKRLILARDRRGSRPLYFRPLGDGFIFASEVKALTGEYISVDREALSSHITSPIGRYGVEDVCFDILSVGAGEAVIITPEGIYREFYRTKNEERKIYPRLSSQSERISIDYRLDSSRVGEYLGNALLAFDFPQFDVYMPSVMDAFEKSSGRVIFEDAVRSYSLDYSYCRQDRLGSLFGVCGLGIYPSAKPEFNVDELYAFERVLWERCQGRGISIVRRVLGNCKYDRLFAFLEEKNKKPEEAENSIRILGMICQLIDWSEVESLVISDSRESYPYSRL